MKTFGFDNEELYLLRLALGYTLECGYSVIADAEIAEEREAMCALKHKLELVATNEEEL